MYSLCLSVIVILLVRFKVSCSAHHCCLWWAVNSVHHDDSHRGNACVNARTLQIQVSKVEGNIKRNLISILERSAFRWPNQVGQSLKLCHAGEQHFLNGLFRATLTWLRNTAHKNNSLQTWFYIFILTFNYMFYAALDWSKSHSEVASWIDVADWTCQLYLIWF